MTDAFQILRGRLSLEFMGRGSCGKNISLEENVLKCGINLNKRCAMFTYNVRKLKEKNSYER